MSLNIESLSSAAKARLLARIAHSLTVCARYTYEVGTENVLHPQTLRAYNELLHRVTSSVVSHLSGLAGAISRMRANVFRPSIRQRNFQLWICPLRVVIEAEVDEFRFSSASGRVARNIRKPASAAMKVIAMAFFTDVSLSQSRVLQ
jgi:hypothetical protein